jgi:hypothetical protein
MAIRFPLAFVVGLVIYMIAMAMTVYDGALSLIFQPIVGSILTLVALLALCIVGSPLLITAVWKQWRRAGWFALLLSVVGVLSFIASWHPSLRVKVLDRETNTMAESFQPFLAIGGWLVAMFGLLFCPAIGFRGDRRWV